MMVPSELLRLCRAALTPLEARSKFAITSPATEPAPAEVTLVLLDETNGVDPWMPLMLIDMTTPGEC
jgi:hypothetical protein